MNKLLALAATAVLFAVPSFAQTFGPLLTPAELSAAISAQNPLILDIRAGKTADDKPLYDAGHIPGAVAAPYGLFRGPQDNPGALPDLVTLNATLQSLGVSASRPIVVVHQGDDETDFGAAARVYWTLKSSGVSQLAILNGGFKAWQAATLPVSTDAVTPVASTETFVFADTWLATTDDVLKVTNGETQAKLVDARPESFWNGDEAHAAAGRPGTLPQSQYFTHSRWFSDDPTLIDAAGAKALAQSNGYAETDSLVSFCNTGHWAATNWFALSELAGVQNVKLYPESMVGWSNAGHPMDNVPGPMKRMWQSVKGVF